MLWSETKFSDARFSKSLYELAHMTKSEDTKYWQTCDKGSALRLLGSKCKDAGKQCVPVYSSEHTHTKRSNTSSITDPDRIDPDIHHQQNDKSIEVYAFRECESERQPQATTRRTVTTNSKPQKLTYNVILSCKAQTGATLYI